MWSEGPFSATPRYQRAPSAGAKPLSKLSLSVRLVMKMSVILCNVMWGDSGVSAAVTGVISLR